MSVKHGGTYNAKQNDHLTAIAKHANDLLAASDDDTAGPDAADKHGTLGKSQKADKVQAIHDHAGELGAGCGETMTTSKALKSAKGMMDTLVGTDAALDYARQEIGDIASAAGVLSQLAYLMYSEIDEPADRAAVTALMRGVMQFIDGEIVEMEAATAQDDTGDGAGEKHKEPAQLAERKPLNLSYAKRLGIEVPELAVKFVGRDEIRAYSNLWGGPTITDMDVEYFTKSTNFWDDVLGQSPRPLTWDHAQDESFKASPIIGTITEMGDDDLGRWYTAKLERSHKYRKYIDGLIEKKAIGTSSDSAPQYVERVKTGKSTWLKTWPLFAAALTEIPCEPRMLGSVNFKTFGIDLDKYTTAPGGARGLTPDEAREASILLTRFGN